MITGFCRNFIQPISSASAQRSHYLNTCNCTNAEKVKIRIVKISGWSEGGEGSKVGASEGRAHAGRSAQIPAAA